MADKMQVLGAKAADADQSVFLVEETPAQICPLDVQGDIIINNATSVDISLRSHVVEFYSAEIDSGSKRFLYRAGKRCFDVTVCSASLVFLAIPMLIIALLIKLDSPGPVLYRQERLGLNGKPFTIVKFRSMEENAEAAGAQWTQKEDPRVTKVGRVLRRARLDELPQFINVICGEMSLIGPRPERQVFYDEFEFYIPGYRRRMTVKPGVSGLAQVTGGYDFVPEEKLMYDLEYIEKRSFLFDLCLIFRTLAVVFTGKGAR